MTKFDEVKEINAKIDDGFKEAIAKGKEQEAALQPFANLNIDHLARAPDNRIIWILNEVELTVGDIRQAKRVLGMDVVEFDPSKVSPRETLPPLGNIKH